MKREVINNHIVILYDSIDELPIIRFHKYNKYMLIDSGIGSDLNDINVHIDRAIKFIGHDPDLAVQELNNLRQNLYLVAETINPAHLAFMCLVHSIDHVICNDLSDEGLRRTMEKLNNVPKSWFDRLLQSIKKKIEKELNTFFPRKFEDSGIYEVYDLLRKRTLLQLEEIKDGKNREKQIEKLDLEIALYNRPKCFYGPKSVEVRYDKDFDKMCLLLSKELNIKVSEISVQTFYNSFDYLKEVAKARNKAAEKGL